MSALAYLYRQGDGNEGNYPRGIILLSDTQCPCAALVALVANRYIPGCATRRHILRTVETEGEPEFGVSATVYEGPKGEQAFDAAWLTAELEPLSDADLAYYADRQGMRTQTLRDALDETAWRTYMERAGGPVNLDDMPGGADALMSFWGRHQGGRASRELFPDGGAGTRRATAELANYASNKATAMRCRLAGDIGAALTYEGICERIYAALPAFARW